jgi:RNA polymerase sigma-70 factor (ECF subfamily)
LDSVAVAQAIAKLPVRQRLIVGLYYLGDLSVAQVSEATRRPVGTVKSELHNARRALATLLEDNDDPRPVRR